MKTTPTLTLASLKMFVRNKQALFFSLFMPIVIMTIFGFIGFDQAPKFKVGVVAENPSEQTEQLVKAIENVSVFELQKGDETTERAQLEDGKREAVIVFGEQQKGVPQQVTILKSISKPQQAQTVASIVTQILDKTTLAVSQAPQLFELKVEELSTRNVRYIDFLLPGIIAMSIMQMSVFSVAFVFTDYKEKGILKRLIATPMKPYQFITANVVVRLLLSLVQTGILIAIGVVAFKSQVLGSLPLVGLISVLGSMMFLGMGFTISGLSKTVEAVPAIANLVAFPMLFLSGVFFPVDAMPVWLQKVVQFLPLTHFAESLRNVMANGAHFVDIQKNILWMLGWAIVFIVLAQVTFSFEEKRM